MIILRGSLRVTRRRNCRKWRKDSKRNELQLTLPQINGSLQKKSKSTSDELGRQLRLILCRILDLREGAGELVIGQVYYIVMMRNLCFQFGDIRIQRASAPHENWAEHLDFQDGPQDWNLISERRAMHAPLFWRRSVWFAWMLQNLYSGLSFCRGFMLTEWMQGVSGKAIVVAFGAIVIVFLALLIMILVILVICIRRAAEKAGVVQNDYGDLQSWPEPSRSELASMVQV
jgi:hypothetical protein